MEYKLKPVYIIPMGRVPDDRFTDLLTLGLGPERTAGIAAWFQSLYERSADVPVLVGGGAVELYTGGSYVTEDLDFVGRVPTVVARTLKAAGFRKSGRHWIHEPGRIFIELPASQLEPHARVARIRLRDWVVIALSPEDILLDRLAAWKLWASPIDGVNAFLLWRAQRAKLDRFRLQDLAAELQLDDALADLLGFTSRFGRREPTPEELEQWSRRRP